jgi:soluble lytic murein transglycosylase-like protein
MIKLMILMCSLYGVPCGLVDNLIQVESGWCADAIGYNSNGTYDIGLMQLNSACLDDFARWHGEFDVWCWKDNMRVGIKHLRWLYDRIGDWEGAVIAYHIGEKGYYDYLLGKREKPIAYVERICYNTMYGGMR